MRKFIDIINESAAQGRIHASRQTGRLMNLKPRMTQPEAEQTLRDLADLCDHILEWCENRGEVSIAMKRAVIQARALFPQTTEMCMSNPNVPRNIRDGLQLLRDELQHYNVLLEAKRKSMIVPKEDKSIPKCTACNGSGRYDTFGSPKCSACKGTGDCPKTIAEGRDWDDDDDNYIETPRKFEDNARVRVFSMNNMDKGTGTIVGFNTASQAGKNADVYSIKMDNGDDSWAYERQLRLCEGTGDCPKTIAESNPNRVMANLPKNPSDYRTFRSAADADAFAAKFKEQGYKVKVSSFKLGSRKAPQMQYRVSVYWTTDQKEPNLHAD